VSVHTVAYYVVQCNGRCGAEYLAGPVGSAYAARVEAGKDGWQFVTYRPLEDGTRVRENRDLCPGCDADIPFDPSGTT
jgi:hypothetical protein